MIKNPTSNIKNVITPISKKNVIVMDENARKKFEKKGYYLLMKSKVAIVFILEENEPYLYNNGRGTKPLS